MIPKLTKYIPHSPTPKQQAFLLVNCQDAFYGGAAGGGKSDALMMAALQYVDKPGYNALLLRDSYNNLILPEALISRSHEWLDDTDAIWHEKKFRWSFPSGATLSFGYLKGPKDHLRYKSSAFAFIGIDEASDLRWYSMRYMFSRLRKLARVDIPVRFRLASNPGGISHEDLKAHYIDEETRKDEVVFIPASLSDNPFLDRKEYLKSLSNLDPVTRRRLEEGDWTVKEKGQMFDRTWFEIVAYPPPLRDRAKTVRYWDLAGTEPNKSYRDPDYTVGAKVTMTKSGVFTLDHVVRFRKTAGKTETAVAHTAEMDGLSTYVYIEQEPGSSGKAIVDHYARNILRGFIVRGNRSTGKKTDRAALVAGKAEMGYLKLVAANWIPYFLDELELFPDGKHDDQVDAISGAINILTDKGIPGTFGDDYNQTDHLPASSGMLAKIF